MNYIVFDFTLLIQDQRFVDYISRATILIINVDICNQ